MFCTLVAVAAMIVGLMSGSVLLIVASAAAVVSGIVAIVLHRRLGEEPLRSRTARAGRLHAELATWAVAPPMAVAVFAIALHPSTSGPETTQVSGKPAEVRSETRRVIMPDGQSYYYWCGSRSRQRRDCPAFAKWKALPRWPEPKHVEMQVIGTRIYGLSMDDEVIVDIKTDDEDKQGKAMLALAGLGLAGAAIVAIRRRVRELAKLRRPTKRRLRASDREGEH
jgi:hypothetical protein